MGMARSVARAIDLAMLPTVTLLIGTMMLFGTVVSAAILLREIATSRVPPLR